jgi:3-oxoacyl-[acyl-carrier protein] reductase
VKTFVVTGAGGGIGGAIVESIAKNLTQGVVCACFNHSAAAAEALKKNLETKSLKIDLFQANLENAAEAESLAAAIIAKYGQSIFVLVNCAGFVEDKDFNKLTAEDFSRTLSVNLIAPFILSQKLAAAMVKNGGGRIVNISSSSGSIEVHPTSIDYDASKAALNSLTKNLSIEFAPTVNVNAVAPGWVSSANMNEQLDKSFLDHVRGQILLGRFAEPSEVADLVWFLLGEKSNYITGALIPIDGGLKLK